MAQIDTIRILYEAGNSQREISRLTGIHRETIGRYIQELKHANPAGPRQRV